MHSDSFLIVQNILNHMRMVLVDVDFSDMRYPGFSLFALLVDVDPDTIPGAQNAVRIGFSHERRESIQLG